jgi:hypothetical protein
MMQTQEENGKVGIYVAICEIDTKEEVDRCNGWTVATEELALVALPPLTTPTTNSALSEGSSNVISASGRSKCETLRRRSHHRKIGDTGKGLDNIHPGTNRTLKAQYHQYSSS